MTKRRSKILFVTTTIFLGLVSVQGFSAFVAHAEANNTNSGTNNLTKDTSLYQLLWNPLLVTGFGAIIATLLVPRFTRQWQDRQKEIAIKSDLVQKISESVTNLIESMSFRFVVEDKPQKERAFREWRSKSAVIGAEVRVYFSGSKIIKDSWNEVYYTTIDFFFLFEGLDKQNAHNHFDDLKKYTNEKLEELEKLKKYENKMLDKKKLIDEISNMPWDLIKKECVESESVNFSNKELRTAWERIYYLINHDKYEVIRKILTGKVEGFSSKSHSQDREEIIDDTRPV